MSHRSSISGNPSELHRQGLQLAEWGTEKAKQGRLGEAEGDLRQALDLLPANADITYNLVRVLLGLNRSAEALRLLDQAFASSISPSAKLLLLHAQILLESMRLPEARVAFEKAIAAAPGDGIAELGLAMALGQSGQTVATISAARRAIEKGADSAGARYILGRSLFSSYRFDEAEAEFRKALALRPEDASSHASLAELVWMRTGDVGAATELLDLELQQNPRLCDLLITKARLLETSGKSSEAIAALERGMEHAPHEATLRVVAAQIALALDTNLALMHASRAVEMNPTSHGVLAIYSDTLFACGHVAEAANVATEQLQANPLDNHAIALLASAFRLMDDERARQLYDYEHFVRASFIDTPQGWSSLSDYLKDLASSLHRLHQLQAHPVHQTLRSGSQIPHTLDVQGEPAISAFGQAIDGPIRRYMDAIGTGSDLFRRRNTRRYKLNGLWSVRLKSHGHHVNHFHGKGWLSSACYIELPKTLGRNNGEGWIKFGEPGIPSKTQLDAEYFIRPEPGMLVLFPSWMWHGTVPFEGRPEDRRLTMAFDVLPG